MLNESIVMMINTAGKTAVQGASSIRLRLSESMEPQLGFGGCMPSPKKLNVDSVKIALDRASVIYTRKGDRVLGITCLIIIHTGRTPTVLAFCT